MSQSSSTHLVTELRRWIDGKAVGTPLPATRALVRDHGVGPGTVQSALRTLVAEGLVETRPGVGTFVAAGPAGRRMHPADYSWQAGALGAPTTSGATAATAAAATAAGSGGDGPLRPTPEDAVSLHNGYPDRRLLPEKLVRQALARAARSDAAVTAAPRAGMPGLRHWFAHELAQDTPAGTTPAAAADVTVLPGTQSGLAAIFRAVAAPGDPVVIESPTYWGAILAAGESGVRLVPTVGGDSGPDPVELDRTLTRTGARAFYAQPRHANPTGITWAPSRRREVTDILTRHGAFLIEDDWARDFGMTDHPEPAPMAAHDDAGRVIYLRSLTKSVSPALRVGAVVARGPVGERIRGNVAASAMYVSPLLQTAALDVVSQPAWRTHRNALRGHLRSRRDLLADAVRTHLPEAVLTGLPGGGLNLWVRLPDDTDLHRLVVECERAGVMIASGDGLFPAEPTGTFIRLNFAGPDPGRFDPAVRTIAGVLSQCR
ncbi:PLP-dependent aminotransferase family protein [Corynebacterium kalidii]|uniref:PLP-dependent aminotransferase family protein n=1 Tax=Corynebacterium kalidii TaxID=2931982 RepID=A0A9X2B0D0_9CORY|nr:PLP-dependent aminotransferase family protein [Corynebacterium kalidii]MCJ7859753.1 PLP-dependent aminotransferase family protein [Corynebacterium kalidii]